MSLVAELKKGLFHQKASQLVIVSLDPVLRSLPRL